MAKTCKNCGEELVKKAKFCERCGEAIVEEKEEQHEEEQQTLKIRKAPGKKMPKWFTITALCLSFLAALTILLGVFASSMLPGVDANVYWMAINVYAAFIGPVTLFYIFMIIFFKAKKYERGSAIIPWLHIILYVIAGAVVGIMSPNLFQNQIGWALLGVNVGINFLLLCFGLYFLLREE